jgi:D-3-phosphoglycerate dehydrogenase / 2-oxoglutarate reductase
MSRFKVVVTDQVFPDVDVERALLADIDASLEVADGTLEDALARGRDADALLNTYVPLDADAFAQLERCRIVARYGIGIDNIDVAAAGKAGVVVTNVPDYCVEEVATHALALLLALLRRLPQGDAKVRSGGWGLDGLRPMTRLSEITVGLVGFGRIARRLAESLQVLGCRLIVHDPFLSPSDDLPPLVSLEELLRTADAVSLHAPLTEGTRGMIDAETLALMPEHAVLVNTSRGPLVVLEDVVDALRAGRLRAAGLDVLPVEPPPAGVLDDVPNLLVTPHAAFYSEQAVRESQTKAATQVIKVLTDRTPDYAVRP